MLADYILPSAGGLERPLFQTHAGTANIAYGGDQAVAPYYERQADFYFWKALGLRLGQAGRWPWETFHDSLQTTLSPAGWTWEQFCESGLYYAPNPYQNTSSSTLKQGKTRFCNSQPESRALFGNPGPPGV